MPVGDTVVDALGVRRPLVGVGPSDAADAERLVLAVRPRVGLPLVEVERAADQVAGRLVVSQRGQSRLQLLPLELGLEGEGDGGAVVGFVMRPSVSSRAHQRYKAISGRTLRYLTKKIRCNGEPERS